MKEKLEGKIFVNEMKKRKLQGYIWKNYKDKVYTI